MSLVSIGVVADLFGVSTQTIRNWCKEGMFEVYKTRGGHRRFRIEEFNREEARKTVIYSRVSSHEQKEDMKRQTEELKAYCEEQKIENYEILEDIGSGINYKKKGLKKLLCLAIQGKIERIVISFKDRLVRFGSEILSLLFSLKGIELVVLHDKSEKSFEEQLVEDVLSIMTVYCSKIYGRRSHTKRAFSKSQK